jgi:hypothetical protein
VQHEVIKISLVNSKHNSASNYIQKLFLVLRPHKYKSQKELLRKPTHLISCHWWLLHLVPHGYRALAGDKGWGQKAYNSQSRERPMTAEDKTALPVDNGSRRRRRRTADFMWGIKSVRLK